MTLLEKQALLESIRDDLDINDTLVDVYVVYLNCLVFWIILIKF